MYCIKLCEVLVHIHDLISSCCIIKDLDTVEVSATRTTVSTSAHVCNSVALSGEVTWKLLEQLATLWGVL